MCDCVAHELKGDRLLSRRPRHRRLVSWRRGAAMIEMAVAAPVLFLLLFGLFELGRAFLVQHLLHDSAREGCRVAVLPNSTNAAVTDAVSQSLLNKGISGPTTTILVNGSPGDLQAAVYGDEIEVQVVVSTASISVVPRGFMSGNLVASCMRRKE